MSLSFPDFEKLTVQISCGGETGSGFFITERLILTARHVIVDNIDNKDDIFISLGMAEVAICTVRDHDINNDIALLDLGNVFKPKFSKYPIIESRTLAYNEQWDLYGFPYFGDSTGQWLKGNVAKIAEGSTYDLTLAPINMKSGYDYSGLSGSALISQNNVVGVIVTQALSADQIHAISIKALSEFLIKNSISFDVEKTADSIPSQLQELHKDSIPNTEVLEHLNIVVKNCGGQYLLVHGSPGIGKTVLMTSFEPKHDKCQIIGKYFVKIPNDTTPVFVRASQEYFLDYLEFLLHQKLHSVPPAKMEKKIEQRIEQVAIWLNELSDIYKNNDKVGLIIIDGIDDVNVYGKSIVDFLGVLPESIPKNISVLLSCTSIEVIPPYIKNKIGDLNRVFVSPLENTKCEAFIDNKCKEKNVSLPVTTLKKLADRSEGHPLYMRYLIELATSTSETVDSVDWIDNLPTIGGNIGIYYKNVWDTSIACDDDKVQIIFTIAELRQSVDIEILIKMLEPSIALNALTKFPSLHHLITSEDEIEIYHSSFLNFLRDKSVTVRKKINDNLVNYCDVNKDCLYSISHGLYHTIMSSVPAHALTKCNQEWADKSAENFISPDQILSDLKEVASLAIDLGQIDHLVRVKLLLQRLMFRYNSNLNENTFYIVDALINLGNYREAITYLIRETYLLVADEDALYFLQRFYENGAINEAAQLDDVLHNRFKLQMQNDEKENKISLANLKLKLSLLVYKVSNGDSSKRDELKNFMHKIYELCQIDPEQKEKMTEFIRSCTGLQVGYVLWRNNHYIPIEEHRKSKYIDVNSKTIYILIEVAIEYCNFAANHIYFSPSSNYSQMIPDLESLIDEFGLPESHFEQLIQILLPDSKRIDILKNLIENHYDITKESYCIRSNGVDLNYDMLSRLNFCFTLRGYIDIDNSFPSVGECEKEWEEYLISISKLLSFVIGKAYRIKAENKSAEITIIEKKIIVILQYLSNFSLRMRAVWDRSYELPEEILPEIYDMITDFYLNFSEDNTNNLIEHIQRNAQNQLGLYTEGYRTILYKVSNKLSRYNTQRKNTFIILKLLEAHINIAVQNRIERTPELLRLMELYGRIDNTDKAYEIYSSMLKTSMGPGWYKEDQFSLINTALNLSDRQVDYIQDFAGYLEFASGEMTFQRYIRNDKESFVGAVVRKGLTGKAIKYLKDQVFPNPEIVLKNARASTIDAVREGYGYINGANKINIVPAIANILVNVKNTNNLFIWSLAELFIENNDISRYWKQLIDSQIKILNNEHHYSEELLKRLFTLLKEDAFETNRDSIIKHIFENLSIDNKIKFKEHFEDIGYNGEETEKESNVSNIQDQTGEVDDTGFFSFMGLGKLKHKDFSFFEEQLKKAKEEVEMENPSKAVEYIIAGVDYAHKHNAELWMKGILSAPSSGLLHLLAKITMDPCDVLKCLKKYLVNHSDENWVVVDTLLTLLAKKFSTEEENGITKAVREHIYEMTKTPAEICNDFAYLVEDDDAPIDENELMGQFLIWLLNFPNDKLKIRVFKILQWLTDKVTAILLPLFIKEALSNKPDEATELCAYLLLTYSQKNKMAVWDQILNNDEIGNKIIETKHFMVKYCFLEIMKSDENDKKLKIQRIYERLTDKFPVNTGRNGSQNNLDCNVFGPIMHIIDLLNYRKILDIGFEYQMKEELQKHLASLNNVDFIQSDVFVNRSFGNGSKEHFYRYEAVLQHVLNICITRLVPITRLGEVASILKRRQFYENARI